MKTYVNLSPQFARTVACHGRPLDDWRPLANGSGISTRQYAYHGIVYEVRGRDVADPQRYPYTCDGREIVTCYSWGVYEGQQTLPLDEPPAA